MTGRDGQGSRQTSLELPVLLFVLLVTAWVYAPVGRHGFLRYDDDLYVTANEMVLRGLSWGGLVWSWTTTHASNWHPVTWWSHMADVQLLGLDAGAHHWVNVVFHLATTLLLFFFLRRSTGAGLRSAFVAAVFALHPLHVQSVAWVAERKDVLSTVFWILAIYFYAAYVRASAAKGVRGDVGGGAGVSEDSACGAGLGARAGSGTELATASGTGPRARVGYGAKPAYLLALVSFTLGLLTKPMLVTLPFLLLLLDHWPLGRTAPWSVRVREKLPFFALSLVSAVVTWSVQSSAGAVKSVPVGERIGNALASYLRYAEKTFWPDSLSVFYPMSMPSTGLVFGGVAFVSILVILSLLFWRRLPWLAVGSLWYLGTLVPVIGLIQAGGQAMADRYTYVPMIGLSIVVAWGLGSVALPRARTYLGAALIVATVFALAIPARREVRYWKDDVTLFSRALAVTKDNHVAHAMLGVALAESGKLDEALSHETEAVRIRPDYVVAQSNLGKVLFQLGRPAEAETSLREAIRLEPTAVAHLDLASVLLSQQKLDGALEESQAATVLDPTLAAAHSTLATAYTLSGKFDLALAAYRRAIECDPDFVDAYVNQGITLQAMGRREEAVASFRAALEWNPEHPTAKARLEALQGAGGR